MMDLDKFCSWCTYSSEDQEARICITCKKVIMYETFREGVQNSLADSIADMKDDLSKGVSEIRNVGLTLHEVAEQLYDLGTQVDKLRHSVGNIRG